MTVFVSKLKASSTPSATWVLRRAPSNLASYRKDARKAPCERLRTADIESRCCQIGPYHPAIKGRQLQTRHRLGRGERGVGHACLRWSSANVSKHSFAPSERGRSCLVPKCFQDTRPLWARRPANRVPEFSARWYPRGPIEQLRPALNVCTILRACALSITPGHLDQPRSRDILLERPPGLDRMHG